MSRLAVAALQSFPVVIALAAGCSPKEVELFVDVQTDLVPGMQFTRVETTVLVEGSRTIIPANTDDPFDVGVRVAEFSNLPPDRHRRIAVSLLGGVDITRIVDIDNDDTAGVTVYIDARCLGVVCEESASCLGGECVDPSCLTGAEPKCPTTDAGVGMDGGTVMPDDGGTLDAALSIRGRPTLFALLAQDGVPSPPTSLEVVDLQTMTLVRRQSLGSRSASAFAVSPDGATVYLADYVADTVTFVDVASNTTRAFVDVTSPFDLALHPDGIHLYALGYATVAEIDTRTGRVTRSLPTDGYTMRGAALSADGALLFGPVNNGGFDPSVMFIETAGLTIQRRVALAPSSTCTVSGHSAVIASDRALVWDLACDALYHFDLVSQAQDVDRTFSLSTDDVDAAFEIDLFVYVDSTQIAYTVAQTTPTLTELNLEEHRTGFHTLPGMPGVVILWADATSGGRDRVLATTRDREGDHLHVFEGDAMQSNVYQFAPTGQTVKSAHVLTPL